MTSLVDKAKLKTFANIADDDEDYDVVLSHLAKSVTPIIEFYLYCQISIWS